MQRQGSPPPTQHPRRWAWTHRHAVPMFVASLVAVTLAGSGLIAMLVFTSGGERTDGNGTEAGIDPCVVGSWRVVGHHETIPTLNVAVELTSGGADVVFNPDGTGTTDYGTGMTLEGENVVAKSVGTVSFEYEAADGTFRYLSQESDATITLMVAGVPLPQELTYGDRPSRYECDGDTLRFFQEEQSYEGEYQRTG